MIWDQADSFVIDIDVQSEHIDELGHANNAVYVTWLETCAWQHSQHLGLGLGDYRRLDRAMAVLRHEIDYLAAAYQGDQLQHGVTLLRAQTTFVCIQLSTGKPKRMPGEFVEGYGKALVQPYPLEL